MASVVAADSAIFENSKNEGSFANCVEHHLGPKLALLTSFIFPSPTTELREVPRWQPRTSRIFLFFRQRHDFSSAFGLSEGEVHLVSFGNGRALRRICGEPHGHGWPSGFGYWSVIDRNGARGSVDLRDRTFGACSHAGFA